MTQANLAYNRNFSGYTQYPALLSTPETLSTLETTGQAAAYQVSTRRSALTFFFVFNIITAL